MKNRYYLLVIVISGTTILLMFSALNQFNIHERQISKDECMGGQYCPGATPMPSASLGNKTGAVSLKLYSNFTRPNNIHYLGFRFFDENTNQTIQHVSFFLNITKNGNSLLQDTFHTHTGILTLQINSDDMSFNGTVLGDREAVLGGWMPHAANKPVVVYAPVFNDDSIYHMSIQLLTVDNDNNSFNPGTYPQFDSQISMNNQNQLIIMNSSTIPEFAFAVPILLVSITSLIVFYRIKDRR